MSRKSRLVLLTLSGALVTSACSGDPWYEERAVPTPSSPEAPTSSAPPAAPSTTSSQSPTPSGKPTTLDTMGGPGSGPVPIDGKTYPHSISVSACTVFSTQPTYSFALKKRYRKLTGVVGQDDGSASKDAVLKLVIRGDGRTLQSATVRFGQRSNVSVDVSGVQRLTLSFVENSCGSDGAALAFGSARVG